MLRRLFQLPRLKFELARHPGRRQLLVDVSSIVRNDVRTGIQRVVRALFGELESVADSGWTVQPIFASRRHGYCYASFDTGGRFTSVISEAGAFQMVEARSGDIFLGLDLSANIIPYNEGQLDNWRSSGVTINMVVYDLLPLMRPYWFPAKTKRNFDRWIGVLERQADQCICISGSVAADLAAVLTARSPHRMPSIVTIPLGADLCASFPSSGLPTGMAFLRGWLRRHHVILAVGTVEPRKGYQQLLAALSHHWHERPDSDVALLIVGRPGWKTGTLQTYIHNHPEKGRRLIWLDQASDELLTELYSKSAGLVAASHGEGFGLPIVEALAHGLPVLARDLPVFREVGGLLVDYFEEDAPLPLWTCVQSWLEHTRRPTEEAVNALPRWSDSAREIMRHLDCAGV